MVGKNNIYAASAENVVLNYYAPTSSPKSLN
jgi:hypothetical protein